MSRSARKRVAVLVGLAALLVAGLASAQEAPAAAGGGAGVKTTGVAPSGKEAGYGYEFTDDPLNVRFFRWPSASADGKTIAFQAVGRVYVQEGPEGQPRRLTPPGFVPLEYSPVWSPDGRSIAFVTWDDTGRGHVWKAAATGGPQWQKFTKVIHGNPTYPLGLLSFSSPWRS